MILFRVKPGGNHAICLIGYDDTKNAFKFINSWGTSWGLNGYGYISYSLIEEFDTTGWILYDAKCGLFANSEFNGTELTQYVPINDTVKSLSIFEGITKIGKAAFIGQSGIIKIRLPSTIANIGDNAFENCTSLTEIHIPAAVTDIGAEAFKGCSNLTELTFEDDSDLYSIGVSAFYGCTSLEEVTIPASVVFIRRSAFEYCTSMETLTFEEGSNLRYAFGLEDNAFAYCHSLSEINYNVWGLADFNSDSDVFAMARDSADIQLNIGAEVAGIFN